MAQVKELSEYRPSSVVSEADALSEQKAFDKAIVNEVHQHVHFFNFIIVMVLCSRNKGRDPSTRIWVLFLCDV